MKTYSLSKARVKLHEIILRVKKGEQITITERGKPLALVSQPVVEATLDERYREALPAAYERHHTQERHRHR